LHLERKTVPELKNDHSEWRVFVLRLRLYRDTRHPSPLGSPPLASVSKGLLYFLWNAVFRNNPRVPKIKMEPRTVAMSQSCDGNRSEGKYRRENSEQDEFES
jgi:hypothetical protein